MNSSLESLLDVEKKSSCEFQELTEEEEKTLQTKFLEQLKLELTKVEFFFSENLRFYRNKLNKINDQLIYIKKDKNLKSFKENLELALKELYKEIILMKIYMELNMKAKLKIMKKKQNIIQKLIKFFLIIMIF